MDRYALATGLCGDTKALDAASDDGRSCQQICSEKTMREIRTAYQDKTVKVLFVASLRVCAQIDNCRAKL